MKTYHIGVGGIVSYIPDLGTRRRWAVSFTFRPFYPRGTSPRYPLNRKLGGLQRRLSAVEKRKNSQPPPGIKNPNPDRPARSHSLYRLSYSGFKTSGDNNYENHTWIVFINDVNVATFNYIHEYVMSRLNSGNACFHSVQNLLS
jgi:hypothetical protein